MQRAGLPNQPVLVFKEGTRRTRGENTRNSNIMAATILSEAMKSSLGPKGLDKMIVSGTEIYVTSDGAYMLEKMDIRHPIAKMLAEVAKAQDEETGDGTTTAVVLTGELLKEAKELFEKGIHPAIVLKGYEMAEKKALEIMKDIGIKVDPEDKEMLNNVAKVAMSSKIFSEHRDFLAGLVVGAMLNVMDKTSGKYDVILDDVKVQRREGESLLDTELINGVVIDKEVLHPKMPKKVEKAKIALIVNAIEIKKTEITSKLSIKDPKQMKAFSMEEENQFRRAFDKLSELGVNVLLCQREVAEKAEPLLADKNILAIKRVKFQDMDRVAKATGGHLVPEINELNPEDLGFAGLVEERKFGKPRGAAVGRDRILFIEDCKYPKAFTIFLRGGTKKIVEEADRAIHDALCVAKDVIIEPLIVAGGGAAEFEVSKRLKKYADKIKGKEQLAISAFANALESIPATLAMNAGLNSIDVLTELQVRHEEGKMWYGVDPLEGKVRDLSDIGVYEPALVKNQAITSASEAAQIILRVDDFIFASSAEVEEKKPKDEEERDGEE